MSGNEQRPGHHNASPGGAGPGTMKPGFHNTDGQGIAGHGSFFQATNLSKEDAETATERPVSADGGPYWCYVMAPVEVFDLNDHTRIVATLEPGTWYLAKRDVSGWVHIVAGEGAEGWVAQASVHKQG